MCEYCCSDEPTTDRQLSHILIASVVKRSLFLISCMIYLFQWPIIDPIRNGAGITVKSTISYGSLVALISGFNDILMQTVLFIDIYLQYCGQLFTNDGNFNLFWGLKV